MKYLLNYLSSILLLAVFTSPTYVLAKEDISDFFSPYQELLENHLVEIKPESGGLSSAFEYHDALDEGNTSKLIRSQKELLKDFDVNSLEFKEQALAFWLNTYNFYIIAYIIENQDKNGDLVESVRDYGSWINPYRVFGLDIVEIGGSKYSLSQIEKEILLGDDYKRKGWKEARVHFAVNCASVGCPPLRKKIYTSDNVEPMMSQNTRLALETRRHLNFKDNKLYISRLFDWYKADYEDEAGSVKDFILRHVSADVAQKIRKNDKINFMDYDWSLNKPENFPEFN